MEIIKKLLGDFKPEDVQEFVKLAREMLGLAELEKRLTAIEEAQARLASVITSLARPPPGATAEAEQVNPGFQIPPEVLTAIAKFLESGGKSEFDRLAEFVVKARAIADALNPPSVWDRVFPQIIVRSFLRAGLLTQEESKDILKELGEKKDWRKELSRLE